MDLTPLEDKAQLTPDERLVLRLHEILATGGQDGAYKVELTDAESLRLRESLEILDLGRKWPADVAALNRGLRARLGA